MANKREYGELVVLFSVIVKNRGPVLKDIITILLKSTLFSVNVCSSQASSSNQSINTELIFVAACPDRGRRGGRRKEGRRKKEGQEGWEWLRWTGWWGWAVR